MLVLIRLHSTGDINLIVMNGQWPTNKILHDQLIYQDLELILWADAAFNIITKSSIEFVIGI